MRIAACVMSSGVGVLAEEAFFLKEGGLTFRKGVFIFWIAPIVRPIRLSNKFSIQEGVATASRKLRVVLLSLRSTLFGPARIHG
ncbi:hypothetical protein [Rhizobium sp. BR 249]|uniref:hypothetical protein n=1 Tax=Rhizobium sp. BR 249 TaxID=3040011 RepID=UPI0039BFB619